MKLLSLVFWCLIASTTSGEAKKRKHYTSSSYLDSYQFPDQPSSSNQYNNNGYLETEEESSGESYSDFMDRYYGQGGSNNYQMPSLGGRFDLEEGSGDFFDQEEGSGGNFPTDDEDYRDPILVESPTIPTTRPKTTTTTTTTTTTSTTPLPVVTIFDDPYEGSGDHLIDDELEGSGGCDDEDDEDCQSKTVPTIPTINIPTSTIPKSVDQNPITIFDPTTKSSTSTSTTSTTTSTTTTTTTTATSITTERSSPTSRPSTPSTSSATPPPSTSSPPSTNNVGGSKTNHGFGPNKEKVPTVLVEHRILVVILYSAIVFCLVLGIIVSFCLLMRCRKQEQNEVSSDTASSDLPIIKADAKRYTAQIVARRTSDSPPPLPDLKLFDEAPKSDFNRSRSGGSLRKSKRDLKPPVNPNWL